jgi:hypothetical protein
MIEYLLGFFVTFCILFGAFIAAYKNGKIKYYAKYNEKDKIIEISFLIVCFIVLSFIWPLSAFILLALLLLFLFYKVIVFIAISIVKRF